MAEKSAQEKTEQATPKRLLDSRKKGQVARSRDLNTLILLLAASGGMIVFGGSILSSMAEYMASSFTISRQSIFDTSTMQHAMGKAMIDMLQVFTPLLGVLFIAALTAPLALGGWLFNPAGMSPKWGKLNPAKGFGRMFSVRAPVEALKAFGKFAVVALASGVLLVQLSGEILSLGSESLHQGLAHSASLAVWFFLAVSSVLLIIAMIDVPFQLHDHANKLKMTKQEVKDEQKQTEGSPDVKGRIRAVQRKMAQQRMMNDVPTADVVVTNPTHYAVALRYDDKGEGAPIVVAMGADLVAGYIRKVATANHVPVVEAPPLARALYFNTEIGQEIPAGLFVAVARLLAYVYQLKNVRDTGEDKLEPPVDLPVPDELLKRH